MMRPGLLLAVLTLAALVTQPAGAAEFGRLFSTAEERRALDEIRREYELDDEPVPEPGPRQAENQEPAVSQLTINGVVLRSSGLNSTWINGSQVIGGTTTREGLRVRTEREGGGSVRITLPSGVDMVRLRPGQKIDVVSGSVLEAYQVKQADDDARSAFEVDGGEEAPPEVTQETGS